MNKKAKPSKGGLTTRTDCDEDSVAVERIQSNMAHMKTKADLPERTLERLGWTVDDDE